MQRKHRNFFWSGKQNEASDCPYEWATESLTHSIHSNSWFVQKRVKWLSVWMGHWIIDSLDSFKQLIHSEMSQATVRMNGPLNHWLTRFVQTADSFRNESSDCPYEWATESLTHSIHSNSWFIQKRVKWLSVWMGHSIIDSLDSFKRLIHSEMSQVTVLMNEPQNHWLTRFIQTADSFRNESSDSPYEWATETRFIQKRGFVQ